MSKNKLQNVSRYHDRRAMPLTLVIVGFVSLVLMSTLRALRSYTHLLILLHLGLCLIKASPLMCARASNHFYDLPVLTSIVYSLLPYLVKSGSSSFLSEWPSPPGLHSLIDCRRLWWSSGSGLVFSIYNAPALQKRPPENTVSLLCTPKISAWSSISIHRRSS